MKTHFKGWDQVARNLDAIIQQNSLALKAFNENASNKPPKLNAGQSSSLGSISKRLKKHGVILADEVGMGKTRISVAVINAVQQAGGRVAIIVPPGLGYQWQDELKQSDITSSPLLRSLWQYIAAWDGEGIEKQTKPWFDESIILISHSFSNWRLGSDSKSWRWTLLPELYSQWRKKINNAFPKNYHQYDNLNEQHDINASVKKAAQSICDALFENPSHCFYEDMQKIYATTPWTGANIPNNYSSNGALRKNLESVIGLGLGEFDLVIIDEAHKSRGDESGLSRLLESIIRVTDDSRRLAMTATPIELDQSQWSQMLARINLGKEEKASILSATLEYATLVKKVRACPTNPEIRKEYADKAGSFQRALSPYMLRRDKRQDDAVKDYVRVTQLRYDSYRKKSAIRIDLGTLDQGWRHAICAAEALSIVTSGLTDNTSEELKRLRLTIGNGHGIAAMVDKISNNNESVEYNAENDNQPKLSEVKVEQEQEQGQSKKLERAMWWGSVMQKPFIDKSGDEVLYGHPAIKAAIEEIERVASKGEKVLVFGKYTRPLKCLVKLLNARAMLRSIFNTQQFWPQGSISQDDMPAIKAAIRQLKLDTDDDKVNEKLHFQYNQLQHSRKLFRERILQRLENGLNQKFVNMRIQSLFNAFQKTISKNSENETNSLIIVSRALNELIDDEDLTSTNADEMLVQGFTDIVTALSDRDELTTNGDADADETEFDADALWSILLERLTQEYGGNQAKFSQMMYGATSQSSRRMIQLAFNRPKSSCMVLVAQSMVGREGLNLHKECKTVVLLHPEWNPGVVEQQIGRIDRVGSFWQKELEREIKNSNPINIDTIPRIDIRPVIFKGTYDEYNWGVLEDRWSDLRAQLHGIIINADMSTDMELKEIYDEISKNTPNFYPDS